MVKIMTIRNRRTGRKVGVYRGKDLSMAAKKAVTKIAKRVVNRAAETKYVGELYANEPTAIYGSTVPTGGQPQIFDVCPSLSEGVAENQRTGVKIVPTRHTVDLDLTFNTNNDINGNPALDNCAWDITVHVWYGYVRRYKNSVDILTNAANILANLLDTGAGTTLPWAGSPYDHLKKVNTEWFQLKQKSFRMFRPFGDQNAASLAGGLTTYFPQSIHKTLKLSFKPPKVLQYNEANTLPENYAPVVIVGYQHNDSTQASNAFGAGNTVLTAPALQMMLKQHMFFKDV